MRALVPAQVDPLARARDPREQRLDELARSADEREDRAVVVGVGVDVEQPRRASRAPPPSASIVAAVASLGEVRHRLERQRHVRTLGPVKAYYDRRAPRVRRLVARQPASSPSATGRAGRTRSRRSPRDRWPPCRPRGRSTSPAAPASSPATSAARSSASTRARAMLEVARRAGARTRRSSRATRSRCRSTDGALRPRLHGPLLRPPRGATTARASSPRRGASRPSSSSSTPRCATTSSPRSGRSASSTTARAGRSTSASSTPDGARRGARRRRDPLRRPLVRRRPLLTRDAARATARSPRSSATTASAARAPRPATRSSRCRSSSRTRASARTCSARRRASSRARSGRPWRGRAGQTLRRWLELDEDAFYATFYCASVTRCYPGKAPSGRGDRTPTPREQELCAFWRDWELALLRPAADRHRRRARRSAACSGSTSVTECVGRRFEHDGAVAIPLPHPSGASGWLNDPANRARVAAAVALDPRRARADRPRTAWPLDFEGAGHASLPADVRPPARVPAPVQRLARRLDRARRRLAGRRDRAGLDHEARRSTTRSPRTTRRSSGSRRRSSPGSASCAPR